MRDGMKVQGVARGKGRWSASRQSKGSSRAGSGSGASQRNVAELQALQSLRLIYASARWHDAQVRRSVAISGSQLWALSEIARREGMGVNALAERMALHQTTASNLANALLKKGLIRRLRDGSDRRFVHLHVTSEGRRALSQSPGPHPGLLVDALRKIDSQHLGRLRRDLGALVRLMRRATARAAGETLLGE
jgi:DNA-binding MarR family transcriptional regulator